jgi:hypothetical protein
MALTKQQVEELYAANEVLKAHYQQYPLEFINDLQTFDPRTETKDLKFTLYPFQVEYAQDLIAHIKQGRDLFVEKSRDMGVSWVTLAVIFWFWLFEPGFQARVGSRKETEVDDNTKGSLFGKLDYFLAKLPFLLPDYKPEKQRTFMKLVHPTNGATITGESANPNFARGWRGNVVLFDELAFWPYQRGSWESAGEATPCRLGVTTPSDTPSYAKMLRNSGQLQLRTLHWRVHPHKDEAWYEQAKKTKTEDEVARELDINWEGSTKGIVYPEINQAQIGNYPYLVSQPLYVSWDFGLDGLAVQWWQRNYTNGRYRLLDAYFTQNQLMEYIFPAFGTPVESRFNYSHQDIQFFEAISQLPKAIHFGDPDVEKRDRNYGMTTRRLLKEKLEVHIQTNTKANSFANRRTETKRILQHGVEVNDTPRTQFWLEALRNSRYPQRLENSQATSAITVPVHDIYSHHRTGTEYLAVNLPIDVKTLDQTNPANPFTPVQTVIKRNTWGAALNARHND